MIRLTWRIAAVVVVAVGALLFWMTHSTALIEQPAPAASSTLVAVLYPLYPGAAWSPVERTTIEDLEGYAATSSAAIDTDNIEAATRAFVQYYTEKLAAAGWVPDISREAGGPGSEIAPYTKDGAYVVISFSTVFKSGGQDEPEQCPCDVTLTLFSTKESH